MNEQIDILPSLHPNAYNYLTGVYLFVMNITAAYFRMYLDLGGPG
jgi:hypothetical protein